MNRHVFVRTVLDLYLGLPDTAARRPSRNDRNLAAQLFDRGIALPIISAAMCLASLRRAMHAESQTALQPVRSLHYFLPVIDELTASAPDPDYLNHIHARFADLLHRRDGQISTGSRGR